MSEEVRSYDAPAEYEKSLRDNRVPGNIPRAILGRIQANLVHKIMDDPEIRASSMSKHMVLSQRFTQMNKTEKLHFVSTCSNIDELKALKLIEDDLEVVSEIVTRWGLLARE
jgi:hypothetical protein